jgi:photosystem II stability/assembly factor-like uncharacterized protein
MKPLIRLFASLVWCVAVATAQTPQSRPQTKPSTAAKNAEPKVKAIWEPVNYKQDLALFDVFFVTKEEGWVSGGAGTILHTKDGGTTWTAQLGGDPHAEGPGLKHLFFADATHGWAQAWNTLFRTTDGESWQQVTGDIRGDVFFVSDLKGFRAYGTGKISATNDGGETWKDTFVCHAKMEVQGLSQEKDCDLESFHFPTATVGYAVGEERVTVKTEDGGDTWNVLVGPEEPGDQRVHDVFFLDANTGYEVRAGGKLKRTSDGGQSWQGVIAQFDTVYPKVRFADQEVGWSCRNKIWAYTADGGKHWTSRQVRFPTDVVSFSLPTRDRGYVVGDHGMIYRYRIVPIDYTSKGMMEATAMPTTH